MKSWTHSDGIKCTQSQSHHHPHHMDPCSLQDMGLSHLEFLHLQTICLEFSNCKWNQNQVSRFILILLGINILANIQCVSWWLWQNINTLLFNRDSRSHRSFVLSPKNGPDFQVLLLILLLLLEVVEFLFLAQLVIKVLIHHSSCLLKEELLNFQNHCKNHQWCKAHPLQKSFQQDYWSFREWFLNLITPASVLQQVFYYSFLQYTS